MNPPGLLRAGQTVRIEIDGIGTIENPVIAQPCDSSTLASTMKEPAMGVTATESATIHDEIVGQSLPPLTLAPWSSRNS